MKLLTELRILFSFLTVCYQINENISAHMRDAENHMEPIQLRKKQALTHIQHRSKSRIYKIS
jgi:hypothetical protein